MTKKHLLVQSCVIRTAFSDQNHFFQIEYILNFFHMKEVFIVLYQVLDKLRFWILNLITLVSSTELTFQVLVEKREIQSVFCQAEKVSSI